MKILMWIGIVLAVIVVLFLGVGAMLSNEYVLERSVVIKASPEKVHEFVGNLNNWSEWSPFEEADKTIKVTFGDKTQGVGAFQSWTGDTGNGELEFTASSPDGIAYTMAFIDGDTKMPADGKIEYVKEGAGTKVIWSMTGTMDMPFIGGYFAKGMDSMVGPSFERGLELLKDKCEG